MGAETRFHLASKNDQSFGIIRLTGPERLRADQQSQNSNGSALFWHMRADDDGDGDEGQ